MPEKTERLDVAQLAARDLTKSDFPAEGKEAFRVFFDRKIHERIAVHAAEKLSLEICGVLVGDWHKDENGPYVLINEAVRADKALSNAGDVTFTHEAWNEVNREMDTKFADRKIVGWYHSHPNYGIFLSDRDRFCQDSTFNSPGQIAYVVDPVNGVEGVFCWRHGESKLLPHFWVGDEVHLSSESKQRNPSSSSMPETSSPAAAKNESPARPLSMWTLLLAALCVLLLGYLLGTMQSNADHAQTVFGAVTYYGRVKCLKPGMRETLDMIDGSLKVVLQKTEALAKEQIDHAGDAKEEKTKQWIEVLQRLAATTAAVEEVNKIYSLTPEESVEVQKLIDQKEAELATGGLLPSAEPPKPSGEQPATKPSGEAAPAKPTSEPPAPAKPASAPPAPAKPASGPPAPPAKSTAEKPPVPASPTSAH